MLSFFPCFIQEKLLPTEAKKLKKKDFFGFLGKTTHIYSFTVTKAYFEQCFIGKPLASLVLNFSFQITCHDGGKIILKSLTVLH